MLKPICLLWKNNTGSDRHTQSWVLSWYSLCIEHAVKIKFNPEHDPFADIAKEYPSVPRPELMAAFHMSLGLKEGCPAAPIEF